VGKPKQPGVDPAKPRDCPNEEAQRLEAIAVVTKYRFNINHEANLRDVPATAIAGAILWEGIEDPDGRIFHKYFQYGPGHVHGFWNSSKHPFGDIEAAKVEGDGEGKVPAAGGRVARYRRLRQPEWAITYIAAIMARHADNYETIAQVDIRDNVGVLCTLYHGGNSEERAKKLAANRLAAVACARALKNTTDFQALNGAKRGKLLTLLRGNAQPQPGDAMGPWVEKWRSWIDQLLQYQPGDYPAPDQSTRTV
jgi:hypothetical protein